MLHQYTQTGNKNRQQPTNRNSLWELNLQTNQAKSQISITSNIATSSNKEATDVTTVEQMQLRPKKLNICVYFYNKKIFFINIQKAINNHFFNCQIIDLIKNFDQMIKLKIEQNFYVAKKYQVTKPTKKEKTTRKLSNFMDFFNENVENLPNSSYGNFHKFAIYLENLQYFSYIAVKKTQTGTSLLVNNRKLLLIPFRN
ncbi:hypothetical protein BpHYR1_047685 [Brachionus plicatilis]|uniref:Uncharacterized protein n=1 Tax=Brachionus plicatilis TaxID=10195 RepID=A0A3M7T346_BRAPC|nr:hypothetical protein BpHYR1_047685 [Brachionus plicatilis]